MVFNRDVNFIRKWGSLRRLPRLEIRSWEIFLRGNGDGGENPPEKGLGMGMVFHPPSPKTIKIIFINLYLGTL
jgi:hypothetical protein